MFLPCCIDLRSEGFAYLADPCRPLAHSVVEKRLLLSALTAHEPDSAGICLAVLVGRGGSFCPPSDAF